MKVSPGASHRSLPEQHSQQLPNVRINGGGVEHSSSPSTNKWTLTTSPSPDTSSKRVTKHVFKTKTRTSRKTLIHDDITSPCYTVEAEGRRFCEPHFFSWCTFVKYTILFVVLLILAAAPLFEYANIPCLDVSTVFGQGIQQTGMAKLSVGCLYRFWSTHAANQAWEKTFKISIYYR